MAGEDTLTAEEIAAAIAAASASKARTNTTGQRYTYVGGTKDSSGNVTGGRQVLASPLGVKVGYRAPYRGQRYNQNELFQLSNADMQSAMFDGYDPFANGIEARYNDEDLQRFAALSPDSIRELQWDLENAGLIDAGDYRPGLWDAKTEDGMKQILVNANRAGLTWQDSRDQFIAGGDEMRQLKASLKSGPTFTARLQNPDDLKKAITQGLYNALGGRYVDDAQMQGLVDAYNAQDIASQRAAFNAQVGGGGTVEQGPSPDTFTDTQAKTLDAQGYRAKKFSDFANVFEELIK